MRAIVVIGLVLISAGVAEASLQCYDCHGTRSTQDYRPRDASYRNISTGGFQGNHQNHMPFPATAADCAVCHPGSVGYTPSHRDGVVNLSPKFNASPEFTRYGNRSTNFLQGADSVNLRLGGCSNVNCHFEQLTLTWGSPALGPNDCSVCHGAPPVDGSHLGKHSATYGTDADSCAKCHVDHSTDENPHAHAREAGSRSLIVKPNGFGKYTGGSTAYPNYLPSKNPTRRGTCYNLYCHSDAVGRAPYSTPTWSGATTTCYSCHRGGTNEVNLGKQMNMTSNGHGRLVGPQWIRKYPCTYCHNSTVTPVQGTDGQITDGAIKYQLKKHANGTVDVKMDNKWAIIGKNPPSYDPATKICDNVYCHSDGTTDPEQIRPFAWTVKKTDCNTCHGHPRGTCSNAGCHDGRPKPGGDYWVLPAAYGNLTSYKWPSGQEWKAAIPMFANAGPGTSRANSHARHTETEFTCDHCHGSTIINGKCTDCHKNGLPLGNMTEVAHLNGDFHVNKTKDVVFKDGGSFNAVSKTCSNTACHTGGTDPVWGESVTRSVICLNCHGTSGTDVDDFEPFNGTRGKINLSEWRTTGHGRQTTDGPYPVSGNPAANFPGNPCWYCHDNAVLHKDANNPYRLRQHQQFSQRFYKECGYCHMEGMESECLGCHYAAESMALQVNSSQVMAKHNNQLVTSGCRAASCHPTDATTHKTGSPLWSKAQNDDVKSQYVMMGVCLKCHDDDTGDKCNSCHTAPQGNPMKYSLGFDPGTGFIKPQKARASSVHFGYKHYRAYQSNGVWKGGKFCWDCHDPHGDSNIYMVQKKIATSTDGRFGKPLTRADVTFTRKQSGLDYARIEAPFDGICNVCHSFQSRHFNYQGGDNHNTGRICTTCHEHRFTDSHANNQKCTTCHYNKPVPRHSGFGLPKDCTKCHGGAIGLRMDVMGQFRANSHHVQGTDTTNKQCYACHWESTPEGLIDVRYHEGFNFYNYSTVKLAKVDLVQWGAGYRPILYNTTTVVQFTASKMNQDNATARTESTKLNNHCMSCHSDQNNDTTPFGDCKTPRQYAWDNQSIAARYGQTGSAAWGKYNSTSYPNANKKDKVVKAFSAHGNAVKNQGGFKNYSGYEGVNPNTRNGVNNVNCYDCHSSHGSKVVGTTTSYVTFNGTRNGGNLKETQAGKGGYSMSYKASSNLNTGTVNPYSAGAGQCFDCHLTQTSGTTPWGYQSTFGASVAIMSYTDTPRFGQGIKASVARYPFKDSRKAILGGHMKASSMLNYTTGVNDRINGLCTPCHDPHGVSPALGANQAYAVPLLKGTWLTSPYKEDAPPPDPSGISIRKAPYGVATPVTGDFISWGDGLYHQNHPNPTQPSTHYQLDRITFGGSSRISESDDKFAGLCLRCHKKERLTDGINKNTPFKSLDRVHESVQGWGANTEHAYSCSKCHQPHNSGLPRLMVTNCLDYKHRGGRASNGLPWAADKQVAWSAHSNGGEHRGYPIGSNLGNSTQNEATTACHVGRYGKTYSEGAPPPEWPDGNLWNTVTPW